MSPIPTKFIAPSNNPCVEIDVAHSLVYDTDIAKPSFDRNTPKTWGTWDGRTLNVNQLEHQHLSNIYWFNIILRNKVPLFALDELKRRFEHNLLPYRPDIRFDDEITKLEKRGFLIWNTDKTHGVIIFNGTTVGEAHTIEEEDDLEDFFDNV